MRDDVTRVLAEGAPEVNGFLQRVLDFVAALRRAGLGTTQSEAIEAFQTIRHVDLLDRVVLREAFASVMVTTHQHRQAFDELFELYFPARRIGPEDLQAGGPDDEGAGEIDPESMMQDLIDSIMAGDDDALRELARMAVEQLGRVEGRDGGVSYFQYKVFRAIDLQTLLTEALRRRASDEDRVTPLQERLWRDEFEARIEAFRREVEAEIRRRAAAQRGIDQVADRMVKRPLEELDFFRLSAAEQAEMRAQIRPLARKLATRTSVKRKHGRDGRLDVRKTVRRSMSTGGVPFDPSFKPRKPHKPELFVVCDVSGSVASFARFTLMLVHTLQEQFSKVRSFAFIDTLDEVTALFDGGDFDAGMKRMMTEADLVWLDGHSDYGHSLEKFHDTHGQDVTARSTVIILGDARNNYRATNTWVLKDLQHRSRNLYWLNPEPIHYWGTGDSVAPDYARFVDKMVEVRNLAQLTEFVQELA